MLRLDHLYATAADVLPRSWMRSQELKPASAVQSLNSCMQYTRACSSGLVQHGGLCVLTFVGICCPACQGCQTDAIDLKCAP